MHISTKCSIAIHCLIFIHKYGQQKKVTSKLLSLSTGSNPVIIRNILSALKKEGVLCVKTGTGGATINCPLSEITLLRICKAIEPNFLSKLIGIHTLSSPLCPVGKNIYAVLDCSYKKVKEDLCQSLQQITMESIVNDYNHLR